MSKIALEAEAAMFHRDKFNELRRLTPKPTTTVQTTSIAAVDASFAQMAAAIITLTTTGRCVIRFFTPSLNSKHSTCISYWVCSHLVSEIVTFLSLL